MTFKIFSDDARKQIADHIIGSPPGGHPRFGDYKGTDVHTPQNIEPPCYGSTCPQPIQSCVGSTCPETVGTDPIIDCTGGVAADHSGNCHSGFNLRTDPHGKPFCCPGVEVDHVPPTPGNMCDPGSRVSFAKTNFSNANATIQQGARAACNNAGGVFHLNPATDTAWCCTPEQQQTTKPPNTTPTPVAPIYPDKPRVSDGAPAISGVRIARTVNDITSGAVGLGYLTDLVSDSGPATNAPCDYTTSKSYTATASLRVGGNISKADCKKDTPAEGTLRVKYTKIYNPGSATIPINTTIVVAPLAVPTPANTWCAIVVPCPST